MAVPKPKTRTDEEALLLAMLTLLRTDTAGHLQDVARRYYAGTLSLFALSDELTAALLGAHAQAVHLGRRFAGSTAPLSEADRQFAATVMAEQQAFLFGLLSDIHGGRYPVQEDGALAAALVVRLAMYADVLRTTADKAWTMALPADTAIYWVVTPGESCAGCLDMEANNPYTAATLDRFPGQNECLSNCRCFLLTEDGQASF